MSSKKGKPAPLEAGVLQACQALDNQIARRMQRDPKQKAEHGVQKWEPLQERVEHVASLLVESFGEEEIQLDSLLILTQAFTKALYILTSELGEDGLGEMRSRYCEEAFSNLLRDIERAEAVLKENAVALN